MIKHGNYLLANNCKVYYDYTCQRCGYKSESARKIVAHHIVYLTDGGKNNLDNLVALCSQCHKYVHDYNISPEDYLPSGVLAKFLAAYPKAVLYSELLGIRRQMYRQMDLFSTKIKAILWELSENG